jgi:molecular chaperone GrpE
MTEPVRDNDEPGAEEVETPEASDAEAASATDPAGVAIDQEPTDGAAASDPFRAGGAASPSDTELVALREEFEGLNDRHLRLVAEFNNFKRRSEQERLSAWARAQADLVGRLVDVLDDLQRVADLDLQNATVEAIMEGIDLVERKFVRSLNDAGIETIEPDGVAFDPERMEAMMRVPAESDEQVDQVAQVFQKGYALKGNLIRPARVSVYTKG